MPYVAKKFFVCDKCGTSTEIDDMGDIDVLIRLSSGKMHPLAMEAAGEIINLMKENAKLDQENEYLRRRIEDEKERVNG